MQLVVEGLPDDATVTGLTKEAIEIAVRSRLRAARLYNDSSAETAWSYFYINVNVVGRAFGTAAEYNKNVRDIATTLERTVTTWDVSATGTHGGDFNFILSFVVQHTDKFIDEYLRVNETACD